jgi:hypothetical protein
MIVSNDGLITLTIGFIIDGKFIEFTAEQYGRQLQVFRIAGLYIQ